MAAFIDEGPPSPRHRHRERGPQNIDYEAFLKRHASTTHLLDIHLMRMRTQSHTRFVGLSFVVRPMYMLQDFLKYSISVRGSQYTLYTIS